MTATKLMIDDTVRPVYCGDKYVYHEQVYVVAATPDGLFLLVNTNDGSYWGDGLMHYENLVLEIDHCLMQLVAYCEITAHICPK